MRLLRGLLGLFVAVVLVVLVAPSSAIAYFAPPVPEDINSVARIQLSAFTVQLAIGLIIPILVGLMTKYTLPGWVKGVIMLVLNAIQTLIVQATMADGSAVIDKTTFVAWVLAVVASVAAYTGVYKQVGLTSSHPNGKLLPRVGLGTRP